MNASILKADSMQYNCRALLFSFRRHCRELIDGGFPAWVKKGKIALLMLAVGPILLVIHAIRPFILIRFGFLYSTRLGHFAANTELYLSQRDMAMDRRRTLDLFYYLFPVCNQQLKKMWERKLRISPLAGPLYAVNCHLPGGRHHAIPLPSDQDIDGVLPRTSAHLSFTPEEEQSGQAVLRELGIPEDSPFVCIYTRDSVYLDSISPGRPRRDQDYRNASICNCVPMAEELTRRGYFALRMGAVVNEPLITTNPMIIDYTTKSRSDFMDIFLGAKCRFFIGSTGGVNAVPRIFRRPIVYVNFVPLGTDHIASNAPGSLFLPKKLWLRQERRFMTFSEIVESGAGEYFYGENYEPLGIEVIENTAGEISAVAVEMDERLKGTWQTTEEDQELQQRFWVLLKVREPNEAFRPRVGAEFLRANRDLLD